MKLNKAGIEKIYFLTRTSLSPARLVNLAKDFSDFESVVSSIRSLRHPDLDRDWTLYDYNYIDSKTVFASNIKVIEEKEIFKGTYIHRCSNDKKYLIQIVESSGFCRRCDTQFFPALWWNHPMRESFTYHELKYGVNVRTADINLKDDYLEKLLALNIDTRILNETLQAVHSPLEVEKILNTKYYDWNNPPPASKIHFKLSLLKNVWKVKPIRRLGIHPDMRYFFHQCKGGIERILFQEKNLYSWCPNCFTKFIPERDTEAIELNKEFITIKTYTGKNEKPADAETDKRKEHLLRQSHEYFYLAVLGLDSRCSAKKVIETFRSLSKIYHPDFGGTSETFQKIVKAKNWLTKFYGKK